MPPMDTKNQPGEPETLAAASNQPKSTPRKTRGICAGFGATATRRLVFLVGRNLSQLSLLPSIETKKRLKPKTILSKQKHVPQNRSNQKISGRNRGLFHGFVATVARRIAGRICPSRHYCCRLTPRTNLVGQRHLPQNRSSQINPPKELRLVCRIWYFRNTTVAVSRRSNCPSRPYCRRLTSRTNPANQKHLPQHRSTPNKFPGRIAAYSLVAVPP